MNQAIVACGSWARDPLESPDGKYRLQIDCRGKLVRTGGRADFGYDNWAVSWAPRSGRVAVMKADGIRVYDLANGRVSKIADTGHMGIAGFGPKGVSEDDRDIWNRDGTALMFKKAWCDITCVLTSTGAYRIGGNVHNARWNTDGSLSAELQNIVCIYRDNKFWEPSIRLAAKKYGMFLRHTDMHPTKPWMSCGYSRTIGFHNYGSTQDISRTDIVDYSTKPFTLVSSVSGIDLLEWSPDGTQACVGAFGHGIIVPPDASTTDGDKVVSFTRWVCPGLVVCGPDGLKQCLQTTRLWCRTHHHMWHNGRFRAGSRALLLAGHQGQIGRLSQRNAEPRRAASR